jgi:hypothetical protein
MQGALQWPVLRPVEALLPMRVKLIVLPAPQPPIRQPAKPKKPTNWR